jgi:hypothetical protein
VSENPLTLESIQEAVSNQELRRQWIKNGEEDANQFIEQYLKIET